MLPNVRTLLEDGRIQILTAEYGRAAVKEAIGLELGKLRNFIEENCAESRGGKEESKNAESSSREIVPSCRRAEEGQQASVRKQTAILTGQEMTLSKQKMLLKEQGEETTGQAAVQKDQAQAAFCPELTATLEKQIAELPERIARTAEEMHRPQIRRVINGTGTILHTNLGRAPISKNHMEYITSVITGYSNLEYDLEKGGRGERYSHFEELLCRLTGAEAAIAVNNNASAVLLILSALARGGEAIVSRGELVEIGGKFRIPDVMEQSGASLVEVGTTNKTYLSDYEAAVSENTKLLLKVHTSNYRIVGFTKSVDVGELAEFGRKKGIPVVEDLGSGLLIDFRRYMQGNLGKHARGCLDRGISEDSAEQKRLDTKVSDISPAKEGLWDLDVEEFYASFSRHDPQEEPLVQESVRKGADLVCFSGDKLLGGPQAGIIVGKRRYIEKLKRHPLMRALRIDKFTVTALELVLREYLWEEKAVQNIPVLRMITKPAEEVRKDAQTLARMLRESGLAAEISVLPCFSQIGGGSLPMERILSAAVVIRPEGISSARLEQSLRHAPVPVFGRVQDDAFWLDMRTIGEEDFETVVLSVSAFIANDKNICHLL